MVIYFALLIPVLVAAFLYYKYEHRTLWWEFLIPFAASVLLVIGSKVAGEHMFAQSREYWTSMVKSVTYYESWNEYIHRTCTRTVSCGKNCTRTETYDCSYVDHHPEKWILETTNGEIIGIGEKQYEELRYKFGNSYFIDMNRNYHSIDGDAYTSVWDGDSLKFATAVTSHTYENRVKASNNSIFNFRKIKKGDLERYGVFEYPRIYDYYKSIFVIGDTTIDSQIANTKIQYFNGKYGQEKQIVVYILVFKDQPVDAGFVQEAHWVGGNKNEFVLCVGINSNTREIKWAKTISWTPNEKLKVDVKSFALSQDTLNLSAIADFIYKEVPENYVRREFKEFSYLTVEPPIHFIILTFVLVLALNIGISYWIINNEHYDNWKTKKTFGSR